MYVCIHMHMYMYMYIYTYVCIYTCMYISRWQFPVCFFMLSCRLSFSKMLKGPTPHVSWYRGLIICLLLVIWSGPKGGWMGPMAAESVWNCVSLRFS